MYETKSPSETLSSFEVDVTTGLSSEVAKDRLVQYGPNKLREKKKKPLILVFLSQLNDPMIFVLLAAALISMGVAIFENDMAGFADVGIIMVVVLLNATIGTIQERKAENALEALKKLASPESLVRRDGELKKIKSEELVPGDIIVIEEGDTIGADVRLIKTVSLKTDESSLTGESLPIEKDAEATLKEEAGLADRINCAYMSTPCVYGRGEGVVIGTGNNTEIGKIANLLEGKEEKTPLQKVLAKLSKLLGILTLIIVAVVLGVNIIWIFVRGQNTELAIWMEAVLSAIALAVAAVPEGLPAVVTIVLAVGVQRMVKVNTIVRKLPSVETLGAVSYVCSDKTGTLTQNKMTVVRAYINKTFFEQSEFNKDNVGVLASGLALSSNASVEGGVHGDPTEIALINMAKDVNYSESFLHQVAPRIDEYPFDSVRKMMSTKVEVNGKQYVLTKGAMDSILRCATHIKINDEIIELDENEKQDIINASVAMSDDALRVLALAYKESSTLSEDNLIFIGLVGMVDPPRPEAAHAVAEFKRAGITTVMITGDHKATAFAIAKQLGIASDASQCRSGAEIDEMSEDELRACVETCRVFARVSPENKVQIVKAIKANGHIAAMTGDGVNDAPSLKAADIGIAMGITGTDVAKGAADMVLTDDNFASIEKAVEEGRGIYANIKKTVLFLLSSNIGEVFSMFVAILLGFPSPLMAIQILWVNLVTDSLPAIALGSDKKEDNIMDDKPRNPKESIFAKGGYAVVFGYGALIAFITLFAFLLWPTIEIINSNMAFTIDNINSVFANTSNNILLKAETSAFTVLGLSQLFHMLGMRNIKKSFVTNFKKKNWLVLVSFVVGFVLQILVVELPGVNTIFGDYPLDFWDWLILIAIASTPLVVHELVVLILWIIKKIKQKSK